MAANKRATKKRKTKKQQQQQEKMIWIGIGAFLSLFGLFGILKLGFLGTLVANIFRLVGGNTYLFLCVGMIGVGLWLMIKNQAAKWRPNHFFYGGLLLYLGVLIFLHALLFGRLESNDPAIIANTWSSLLIDLKAGRVAQNVGGGMIGAVLYAGTYFLLAQAGSYFVSVLLMIGGALIISPYTLQDRLDRFSRIKELAQQRYDANADKRTEREEQRQAKKRQKEENQAMKKAAILAEIQAEESQKNAVRPKTPGEKLAEQTKVEVPVET
ncbi:MAG: cell division protein FtsK, partial [Enterococcus italicus]